MPERLPADAAEAPASVARAAAPRGRRIAAIAVVVVAAVVFVAANRHDVPDAGRALRRAAPGWLALGLVASAAFTLSYGRARRAALEAFGVTLPSGRATRAGLVAHSVNIVTKSGGMAGLAIYREEARRAGAPAARVLGGYLLAVVLGDLAFAGTLVVAMTVLVVDGRFTTGDALALVAVSCYFVVIGVAVVAAVRSREAIRRLHAIPARLRRRPPDHRAADDLHDAVAEVRRRPSAVVAPLAWMLLIEVLGVTMVWCSLRAYGVHAGLTVPLVGYAISVLFSMIGFLPAGVGFAEASLGAVLVSFGVAGATATVVVLTYRVLETWIPLLAGTVAAHRRVRREVAA